MQQHGNYLLNAKNTHSVAAAIYSQSSNLSSLAFSLSYAFRRNTAVTNIKLAQTEDTIKSCTLPYTVYIRGPIGTYIVVRQTSSRECFRAKDLPRRRQEQRSSTSIKKVDDVFWVVLRAAACSASIAIVSYYTIVIIHGRDVAGNWVVRTYVFRVALLSPFVLSCSLH